MSIATSGFGTLFQGVEEGASVPSDGFLTGDYQGSVVCEGDATISGDTSIKGDLIVYGTLYNTEGHDLEVGGDLIAFAITFENPEGSPGDIDVAGDLIFQADFLYQQLGEVQGQLQIGGNFIGARTFLGEGDGSEFDGSGSGDGSAGAFITVGGNVSMGTLNIQGGTNSDGFGGTGGRLTVNGSLTLTNYLNASGGGATNGDAGNGGDVQIVGMVNCGYGFININGGSATNGSGGNGGELDAESGLVCNELNMYGGNCDSNNPAHYAGGGGDATIDGSFVSNDSVNHNGGYRSGTLPEGPIGTDSAGGGGYLNIYGDAVFDDVSLNGGDVDVSGPAPQRSGRGGELNVQGNCTVTDDLRLYGGYNSAGHAGFGGYVYVDGNLIVDGDLDLYGGNGTYGEGGGGGEIYVGGDANFDYVELYGGNANSDDGLAGNAGDGGEIFVEGDMSVEDNFDLHGGNCTSTDPSHSAGAGGILECRNLVARCDMNLYAGERYGTTTSAYEGGDVADGGRVTVYGNAVTDVISVNGGGNFTAYPSARGGNGGTIDIGGTLTTTDELRLEGDQGVGANGGNGGTLYLRGFARVGHVYVGGGGSVNSTAGEDYQTNGSAGSVYAYAGITGYSITALDGVGDGNAPTDEFFIEFSGACNLIALDVQDRFGAYIRGSGIPVTLSVTTLGYKTTFNSVLGLTVDLSSMVTDSIFMAGAGSNWYRIQGTSVLD